MSSNFSGNPNNILPTTYIIPEDSGEKDLKLRDYFNSIATAVNSKDSGIYDAVETVTGQQFYPTFSTDTAANVTYRGVLRKVIDFGALPNATTKSVAHGITFTSTSSLTKLYGAATDAATPTFIPLPYSSTTLNNNIILNADGTNINITTAIDYSAFTRTFIVIEWITTT